MGQSEISRHEILVYEALARGEWITTKEIAETTGVAPRTARLHAFSLVKLGIAEQAKVSPGYRYRISGNAAQRNRGYHDRLERAREALGM